MPNSLAFSLVKPLPVLRISVLATIDTRAASDAFSKGTAKPFKGPKSFTNPAILEFDHQVILLYHYLMHYPHLLIYFLI